MPRPRPPSSTEAVSTPLFGLCWYGDPGDGTSIVAYCGGGGSAATGVRNFITVRIAEEEDMDISTEDQVGVALKIIRNPLTRSLRLYVALGSKVVVYSLPSGDLVDEVSIGDNVNCIAVNSMADQLAVGCESGPVKMYQIQDDKINDLPDYTLDGHTKAVCAVAFSPRENTVVSSAKDGTARVWKKDQCLGVLTCSIKDPKSPPPKRVQQVLVRGCDFGDLNGHLVYTVASGRRGRAFLSKWELKDNEYVCLQRTECSPCPVSAMSLSGDAGLLALGAVDGSIILWGVERWKTMKKFFEVHDLPVTCIGARPYPVPLKGDEDGVQMHALSASADSQIAWLTMQRQPSKRKHSDASFKSTINFLVRMAILAWILYPLTNEVWDKCEDEWKNNGYGKTWECIRHDVLIAPATRPGISVPPY
jgi:WD40 repeat protein